MAINVQDQKAIQSVLSRIYEVLRFTTEEIKEALNDLARLQQLAVSTELLKSLTESEVAELNKDFAAKSEDERKLALERIIKSRVEDEDFAVRAQAEAKKVLNDHITYLQGRGDDTQRQAIEKILIEIK